MDALVAGVVVRLRPARGLVPVWFGDLAVYLPAPVVRPTPRWSATAPKDAFLTVPRGS